MPPISSPPPGCWHLKMVGSHSCDKDFDNCGYWGAVFVYSENPILVTRGTSENTSSEHILFLLFNVQSLYLLHVIAVISHFCGKVINETKLIITVSHSDNFTLSRQIRTGLYSQIQGDDTRQFTWYCILVYILYTDVHTCPCVFCVGMFRCVRSVLWSQTRLSMAAILNKHTLVASLLVYTDNSLAKIMIHSCL